MSHSQHTRFLIIPLVLGSVLFGCGDNAAPLCSEGEEVLLQVYFGTPAGDAYVRVRSDDSDWHKPEQRPAGNYARAYSACAARTYSIVVACANERYDPARPMVTQINSTPWEQSAPHVFCGLREDDEDETVLVEGRMLQPGMVYLDQRGSGDDAFDWYFSIPVRHGTHDLVATTPTQIAIQRDVRIDRPALVGTIDMEREGSELLVEYLTVSDTASTTQFDARATMETRSGTYSPLSFSSEARLLVPPPELLVPGDTVSYFLLVRDQHDTGQQVRTIVDNYRYAPISLELPPRLDPAIVPRGGATSLSLALLPRIDGAWPILNFLDPERESRLECSPGWLTATGATEIGFDLPPDLDTTMFATGLSERSVSMSKFEEVGIGVITSVAVPRAGRTP